MLDQSRPPPGRTAEPLEDSEEKMLCRQPSPKRKEAEDELCFPTFSLKMNECHFSWEEVVKGQREARRIMTPHGKKD